ncbi:tetratricopeptide repeat protein [Ectothiorhodospira lacustris]|uniref:tetratricopeptide repeat protein n=1 Tax=Ectothiorhodospira lacustris TaxID=2899127 RepID=UPI001EE90D35|nr:tetratricopeptide repeat protein [Ectothiorhodospira lacustris]MCG5501917.1 sel1 repeat family protein [Ectothiorhodospira lacustris]MCG5509450.1 sel1 repeat family protein [Ectothiorhodospira lacustris]MCG5521504.1 sel1 repeat family protein [Ectothiorhodospira lacustris]
MRILLLTLLLLSTCAVAGNPAPVPDPEAQAHRYLAQDPPAHDRARALFMQAAEQGSPTAMAYLGWLFEHGHGTAPDGEQAVYWYSRAARAGALPYAMHLGWIHLKGELIPRDREASEGWFRYAIERGHAPAQVALASIRIADALGGRDPDLALEAEALLLSALEAGESLALYFLARLYIEGIGSVTADDDKAFHYTRRGAQEGHPRMQAWLAMMHADGRGVAADPVAAIQWSNLAAAGGDELGMELHRALESRATPEQIQEGRGRAVAWALSHGQPD